MDHRKNLLVFLGSRIGAASLNLLSVAIFTRLGGVDIYGSYLLVFAWAFVLHGVASNWINEAFFARYQEGSVDRYLSTAFGLKMLSLVLLVAPLGLLAWQGALDGWFAFALALMTAGIALHIFAIEASRTRMHAGLSAAVALSRSVLMVVAGTLALLYWQQPMALSIAVAGSYALSALPLLVIYRGHLFRHFRRDTAMELLRFGWPLLLAGGTWALAQNIDRIALGYFHGPASVGPYGAMADFLKQGFFVFGEVVALSLITHAKRAVTDGREREAREALREAMRTITMITVFGSILVLELQDKIIALFFGVEFHATAKELLPLLLLASSILVFRTYYFGQVVYFLSSGLLQAYASGAQLLVTLAAVFLLVPTHGVHGAAIALIVGQATSCAVVALWPNAGYRLPIPLTDMLRILCAGLAVWLLHLGLQALVGGGPLNFIGDMVVIAVTSAVILWYYDLFATRLVVRHVFAFAR